MSDPSPLLLTELDELYVSQSGWLRAWLRHRMGCDDDAADLAHDTFVRLLAHPKTYQLKEPRAFLKTVAHGLMVNLWRRRDLERAYLEALAYQPEAMTPSAEQQAIVIETLCEVDSMLQRLSSKARAAFLLSQLDGLTYAQIGIQLEVSERMVKKYMAQAMLECLLLQAA